MVTTNIIVIALGGIGFIISIIGLILTPRIIPRYLFSQFPLICRRCTLLVYLLLIANFSFGQSNMKLHQIKPKWKLGDQKTVYTNSGTKIYIKDSLINSTVVTSSYSIKIIDTVKYYTLLYSNGSDSIDIETKSYTPKIDSLVNYFTEIIKKIEKETNSFIYELLVDKNTGQAFKVKNSDTFLNVIEQLTTTMIDELGKKIKKSNIQIDSMKQKVIAYFKLAKPKILETIINQFNYIMQPYSYEFPYDSAIIQKAMIHDVNALGEFGDIEFPATLSINSKKRDNTLTIHSYTDYDKDFLLEQIKKKHKNMSNLTTSDIYLSEKAEVTFSITNSWVVSHKSNVMLKIKEVKVVDEAVVTFH